MKPHGEQHQRVQKPSPRSGLVQLFGGANGWPGTVLPVRMSQPGQPSLTSPFVGSQAGAFQDIVHSSMKCDGSLRTFDGSVAIITGGASGIGRALGEALARRGANVVLADVQVELAEEVSALIRENGGQATTKELDVTDFSSVNQLVQNTFQTGGRLDYIFNNAGIGIVGEARLYELSDWARLLDVNLRGVIHGVQAAYPIMLRQGFGHIVNTASFAGLFPSPLVVGYCAAKHAVVGLSTSLRIEAAGSGVRVSVLCPGPVRTRALMDGGRYGKMLQPIPPEVLKAMVDRQHPITAERFAEQALRALAKNRAIIVIPSWWKIAWWFYRLSPSLGFYLGRKGMEIAKRAMNRTPPNKITAANSRRAGQLSDL